MRTCPTVKWLYFSFCFPLTSHSQGDAGSSSNSSNQLPGLRQLCGGSEAAIERMLQFGRWGNCFKGVIQNIVRLIIRKTDLSSKSRILDPTHVMPYRDLHAMSVQLRRTYGKNEVNKQMLQEAFSLLAYADPWNSPVGAQLDPARRETICSALNSAILGKSEDYSITCWLIPSTPVESRVFILLSMDDRPKY